MEIVRLLGFARSPEANKRLTKLLDSDDAAVRSATVFALGVSGDPGAVKKLTHLLDDKDAKVASQAAIALGRIGDKSCYEALEKRLVSKYPLQRLSAIKALGLLGEERAVGRLEEHLAETDDPLETTAVLDALNLIAGDDLFRIVRQLERLAGVLETRGAGRQTQLAQAAVTEAMDRFIEEQEKKQQKGGGKGKGKGKGKQRRTSSGKKPGGKSGSASGKSQGGSSPRQDSDAGDADATDSAFADIIRTSGVVWGDLPPAVQEEITAALKQEFPERYKHMLGLYYKILAEGK